MEGEGIGAEGRPVRLSRDFVREGIRRIAEDLCTRQLGHRKELDGADAQRREVHEVRYTSLDGITQCHASKAEVNASFLTVTKDPNRAGLGPTHPLTERRTAERLMIL